MTYLRRDLAGTAIGLPIRPGVVDLGSGWGGIYGAERLGMEVHFFYRSFHVDGQGRVLHSNRVSSVPARYISGKSRNNSHTFWVTGWHSKQMDLAESQLSHAARGPCKRIYVSSVSSCFCYTWRLSNHQPQLLTKVPTVARSYHARAPQRVADAAPPEVVPLALALVPLASALAKRARSAVLEELALANKLIFEIHRLFHMASHSE